MDRVLSFQLFQEPLKTFHQTKVNMAEKPKINSVGEKELEKCETQIKALPEQAKELIMMDRMKLVPKIEYEGQPEISQQDVAKSRDIYLKPRNYVASQEKFNEKWRKSYEYDKEYVQFVGSNTEIREEEIPLWTKPYPGCPAEFWKVPVNKPVWGPRYLMEQLQRKQYHVLEMKNESVGNEGGNQYYGKLAIQTVRQRLDAREISSRKSISMLPN